MAIRRGGFSGLPSDVMSGRRRRLPQSIALWAKLQMMQIRRDADPESAEGKHDNERGARGVTPKIMKAVIG